MMVATVEYRTLDGDGSSKIATDTIQLRATTKEEAEEELKDKYDYLIDYTLYSSMEEFHKEADESEKTTAIVLGVIAAIAVVAFVLALVLGSIR